MPSDPLVIIPARLHSSRLPGKPLKRIGSKTLVEHARDSALEADVVPFITSDSMEVLNTVYPDHDHSFRQVCLTSPDLESGTDRCAAFIEQTMGWDDAPDWIINVQGDMPFGTAPFIRKLIELARHHRTGAITLMVQDPIVEYDYTGFHRIKSFRHVGVYAYSKDVLRQFHECGAQDDEKRAGLEQLRFKHIGVNVDVFAVNDALPPLEVNTQADLYRITEIVARCQPGAIGTQQARNLALAAGG